MSIATREAEILRITGASFYEGLHSKLEEQIRAQVVVVVKSKLEAALEAELKAELATWPGSRPRRSGYFKRIADTLYGRIAELRVPKLRCQNQKRQWRILARYRRALQGLLDWAAYLYVMGLSLRDLQEALYFLLGNVLSRGAVNEVTLRVQAVFEAYRATPMTHTPVALIVDGVWVEIQYTLDTFKTDRAGHRRQCRAAQERVILAVLGVYADGTTQMVHFEVATAEEAATGKALFAHLIARGLDPQALRLIVSDGTKGRCAALRQYFPHAQQQRCITHKVRGMQRQLQYRDLPPADAQTTRQQRKQQRWAALKTDAYAIYDAASYEDAQQQLQDFVATWQTREPQAVHTLQWGIEATFTFYQFEAQLWPRIRTTNALERLFREFRTKADEIGAFPNELSCLTLFFLVMQRYHAKHDLPFMAKT